MDFDISLHVKFKTKGLRDANMKIEYNKQMEWAQIQKKFTLKAPGTYLLSVFCHFFKLSYSPKSLEKIQILGFSLVTQRVSLKFLPLSQLDFLFRKLLKINMYVSIL